MGVPYSLRVATAGPDPVPNTGQPDLEGYIQRELHKLWIAQHTGTMQFITLEVLGVVPPNVFDGMICFFSEGVINPQRGLYEYDSGAWHKL